MRIQGWDIKAHNENEVILLCPRCSTEMSFPASVLDTPRRVPNDCGCQSGVKATIGSVTKTLNVWARESGINVKTLQRRYRMGWPEELLLLPVQQRSQNVAQQSTHARFRQADPFIYPVLQSADLTGTAADVGHIYHFFVIRDVFTDSDGSVIYTLECRCARHTTFNGHYTELRKGKISSCGCHPNKGAAQAVSKTYREWRVWKNRCLNPEYFDYRPNTPFYEHWMKFDPFEKAVGIVMGGFSIELIDPAVGFMPGNLVWKPNVVKPIKVEYNGRVYSISQLAKLVGMQPQMLISRYVIFGWPIEKALEVFDKPEPKAKAKRRTQLYDE